MRDAAATMFQLRTVSNAGAVRSCRRTLRLRANARQVGKPMHATATMTLVAPYFGDVFSTNRAGYSFDFLDRVKRCRLIWRRVRTRWAACSERRMLAPY